LGYWWNSGVQPKWRQPESVTPGALSRIGRFVGRALPVQKHLFDEFLARFPGPSDLRWYLSDGGHFENTGAYELIRRQMPIVIVADCGADPDYAFEDLANLVRKARVDLNTIIEFPGEPDTNVAPGAGQVLAAIEDVHGCLAGLDALRPIPAGTGEGGECDHKPRPLSGRRRVVVGRIRYPEPALSGVLLVVKPTIHGDESVDLRNYHLMHPRFPQEPTSDQYFDEAQWESYRQLGELTGASLSALLKARSVDGDLPRRSHDVAGGGG
jgi:hypothetical protein